MQNATHYPRREFCKMLAAAPAFAAGVVRAAQAAEHQKYELPGSGVTVAANDHIGLATIGMGIIGFVDTETALRVPGVELVAAADLYDGRCTRAREIFGEAVATTRDYREILARADVDAVIIATPDHWHARIAIDALQAGKHVYLEKPMVQKIPDGRRLIEVQKKSKKVLQVGSQYVSSILYEKARELYESGAIGVLSMVEAHYNRNSAIGAWQYSLPPDASPETIDWDRFLGDAPKRPFDPVRFFRWRNYRDYGTGIPGDLYVHLFSGIHHVLGTAGPNRVVATGGLRYWKDGRDVPDVVLGLYEYPETGTHPPFTLSLQTNFEDGSGEGSMFRFVGNEGVITVGEGSVSLVQRAPWEPSEEELVKGYNSVRTFSAAMQEQFVRAYRKAKAGKIAPAALDRTTEFTAPPEYDARFDHFVHFFNAVRGGDAIEEDAVYGLRAAAPSLLTNTSYREQRICRWDPQKLQELT